MTAVEHVVIIMKENHTFDNYFGTFPGANGMAMPRSPNPPLRDPNHTHAAWLSRDKTSVKEQFVEQDIPAYFDYGRNSPSATIITRKSPARRPRTT